MRVYAITEKAMCILCTDRYSNYFDIEIDPGCLAPIKEQSVLWKDYIDACDHCDEYGRDPLPWCELGI